MCMPGTAFKLAKVIVVNDADSCQNVEQFALSALVGHILIQCPPFASDFKSDACYTVKKISLAAKRTKPICSLLCVWLFCTACMLCRKPTLKTCTSCSQATFLRTKQGLEKRKSELEKTFGKGFRTPKIPSWTLGSADPDLRTIHIDNA